jgi:hypothetical protein
VSGPWIAAFVVLWVVVIGILVVLIGVVRQALAIIESAGGGQNGDPRARSDTVTSLYGGAAPGTRIPPFAAKTADGSVVGWEELVGRPRLCVFVGAGCPPCEELMSELAASPRGLDGASLVVFAEDATDPKLASLPPNVLVLEQLERSASAAFRSIALPQAFAVDSDGVVQATVIPNSVADLASLSGVLEGGDQPTLAGGPAAL